jgi:hypothetical protein
MIKIAVLSPKTEGSYLKFKVSSFPSGLSDGGAIIVGYNYSI